MATFKTISIGYDFVTYKELISFFGDRATFEEWQGQIESHVEAGNLEYGCFGKVLPNEVSELAENLDLPASLIEIAETLFAECETTDDALNFALSVSKALRLGVNYELLTHFFGEWILMNTKHGMIRYTNDHRVYEMGYAHRDATEYHVPVERFQNALLDAIAARTEARNAAAKNGLAALRASFSTSKGIDADKAELDAKLSRASVEAAKVAIYTATAIEGVDDCLSSNSLENALIAATDACGFAGEDVNTAKAAQRNFFIELLGSPVFRKVAV